MHHNCLLFWLSGGIWRSFYPTNPKHSSTQVASCPTWAEKQTVLNIYESFFFFLQFSLRAFVFSQLTSQLSLIWNKSGIKIQYFKQISFPPTDNQYAEHLTLCLAVLWKTLGVSRDTGFERTVTIEATGRGLWITPWFKCKGRGLAGEAPRPPAAVS